MKYTFLQLNRSSKLSVDDLYAIAELTYQTDEHIYPAMFGNENYAKQLLRALIESDQDAMFCKDNFFVIKNETAQIIGMILWKKGPLNWSKEQFLDTALEKSIPLPDTLEKVAVEYVHSYDEEHLKERISLINVCVSKEYRGKGIGKKLLTQFIELHKEEEMELCVLVDNVAAIKLYKECGFSIEGEMYNGFSVSDDKPMCVTMQRKAL